MAGAVALATGTMVFALGASAGASSVEKSFEDDGDHSWVVPAGVCSVWIDALGASGGDAIAPGDDNDPLIVSPGGEGGEAKARIAVTPGETLWVFVGGEGEDTEPVPATDEYVLAGEGGFNGGGDGGPGGVDPGDEENGDGAAGGGGASDVRQGGSDLDHRVVVAGGGGGAAVQSEPDEPGGAGGDGGGEEGDDGQPAFGGLSEQGGEGANESEGGDGGVEPVSGLNGDDGEFGEGGDGAGDAANVDSDGGGGGGGGWYGGGGGGGADDDADDGAGGGGGSGFGPDDTEFDTGENDGDGEVTISYDPVKDACAAVAIVVEPKFTG
jgi:hypothetical protein